MMKKTTSFSFPPKVIKMLEKLARDEGVSKSEVLRRAIALYDIVQEEKNNDGRVMIQNHSTGEIIKELILSG